MMYQNTILAKGQFNVGVNKKKREGETGREGVGEKEEREGGERELKPGPSAAAPLRFIKQTRCNYALTQWTLSSG